MSEKVQSTKELLRRLKNNPEGFTYEIAALTAEAALELIEDMQSEHADIVYNNEWDLRKKNHEATKARGLANNLLRLIETMRKDIPDSDQKDVDIVLQHFIKEYESEHE